MGYRRLDDIIIKSIHETGQTAFRWQERLNSLYRGNANSVNEQAEEHFIKNLNQYFPDDQILQDTTHHNDREYEEKYLNHLADIPEGKRIWAIDPIDGVNNFARHSKIWASCLALIENKEAYIRSSEAGDSLRAVQATAIYQPALEKLFIKDDRKTGVYDMSSNHRHLKKLQDFQTSECQELSEAIIGTYLKAGLAEDAGVFESFAAVMNECMTTRAFGSGSIDMTKVAIGRLDAWVMPNVNPWHWLPGAYLVREGGGEIREIGVWKIAAATRELADQIEERICHPTN